MKHLIVSSAALALASAPLFAADPSGKWQASIQGPRGETSFVFDLKADGDALSGTISNDFLGESLISDGKISGNTISFRQKVERGQGAITFLYKGTVKDDELQLTRTVEGMAGGGKRGGQRPGGAEGGPGQRPGGGGMGREISFVAKRIE